MFELVEQAKTILAALGSITSLKRVDYLDDDAQSAAAPAVMPAAWLVMESCGYDPDRQQNLVSWLVVLKGKRLRGLGTETPALAQVEEIIATLHKLRPALGWTQLEFQQAEFMEPQVEGALYAIRFATASHYSRRPESCPA